MVSLESKRNFWHCVFFALGSIALPFHLLFLDTYSRKLEPVTQRRLVSVGCKCKMSPASCHNLLGFVRTAREELKCRRCRQCGSWTGCRNLPSRMSTPYPIGRCHGGEWGLLDLVGLRGIPHIKRLLGQDPGPWHARKFASPKSCEDEASPGAQSLLPAWGPASLQRETHLDALAPGVGPASHAMALESASDPFLRLTGGHMALGAQPNDTRRVECRPARRSHVARPAQLDNAAPSPSAPLPPRPAAAAAPSPFVQDGGAGGAASWAAVAAAVKGLRAARPPAAPAP